MNIHKIIGITATTLAFSTFGVYSLSNFSEVKAASETQLVGKNQRYMFS